ncbi:hypothetical protein [Roseiconus lacunae]|uniref:hypothetical protein n=1 Tax=Roseiconus lacunae TaxID=2605694 RepID=UPI0011F0C797|nr:hypothetical protein [Roseiconus lacunae]
MNTITLPYRPAGFPASKSIDDCDALMVLLRSGKIVITHREGPVRLCSAQRVCKPLRYLRAGEDVYYNGRRDTVRAIMVY